MKTDDYLKKPTAVCFKYGHIEAPVGKNLIRCARCSKILVRNKQCPK